MRLGHLLLLAAWLLLLPKDGLADSTDNYLPGPQYPLFAKQKAEEGKLVLAVTFDGKGHVTKCRIVNSSVPKDLETYTCDFIKANWRSLQCAGKTLRTPVTYDLSGSGPPDLYNLPHPGYPGTALIKGEQGTVVTAVTFGYDGRVTDCRILRSSGSTQLDTYTIEFISKRWQSKEDANKTYTVPTTYAIDHD